MLKHYVKVALRLIRRSFLFSSINMLGFVFGMTAAFLIYLWVVDELTFEDFNKNRDGIYRVIRVEKSADGQVKETPSTVVALSEAFRKEFPQVENATFIKYGGKLDLHSGDKRVEAKWAYVDTTFFDVFSFPVIAGDPDLIKKDPQQVVLSESTAQKLFGKKSAIGKEVVCKYFSTPRYYKVAAVLKVPRKSHIQFDVLLSWGAYPTFPEFGDESWTFSESMHVFIQLKKGNILSEANRLAMQNVWVNHWERGHSLAFQPLKDIHLHTHFREPNDDVNNHGSMSQIYLFIVLAGLIIFMGAFNFMTLSMARASQRFKEIGVRKVTGAKRKMLIMQFLSESLVQAFLSLLLALVLTELLLPLFNLFVGKDIALQFNWQTLLFVLFGIVGVGCLAGSFPAFYMSSFSPLLAFKGGRATGKKGTFIKGLVCVQFIIAITMIIATTIVFRQLHYMQNVELGLDKENMIIVDVLDWRSGADGFKQEVLKNPHVKSLTLGVELSNFLQGYKFEESIFSWQKETGEADSLKMIGMVGDRDFIHTMGLTLLKGDTFGANPDDYWNGAYGKESPIVINETAWKMLKVENPVGMLLNGGAFGIKTSRVVGVVKDFNFQPLREKVKPAYLYYTVQMFDHLYIKISPENQAETLAFLKKQYEEARPNMYFTYQFLTDVLNHNYERERQQSQMFLTFTVLAVFIAMMGVFGLVSLSTAQRTKEIGIRKVNGAYASRIVKMFCYEYMRWVGIAFVIACPLGYLFMVRWLSTFAYQATISWWLFPMAGLIILFITVLTVVIQTWHAASRNPVESLRNE